MKNRWFQLINILLITTLPSIVLASPVIVELSTPNTRALLTYQQQPRLDKVLYDSQTRLPFLPYWEGSKLFNLTKQATIDELNLKVQQQLMLLSHNSPRDRAYPVLLSQLTSLNIGFREKVDLDYDVVRLDIQFNPKLSEHDYQLQLIPRPETITVLGLTETITELPFSGTATVKDYLRQITPLPAASLSFAWIIYPNGKTQRVGMAYWNNQQTRLIPGAILFLGFNSENKVHQQLESDLITLFSAIKN